tara:strand:- start:137 stop:508 length:372 start_codon:yes stop_codon:yes gene_type:complete
MAQELIYRTADLTSQGTNTYNTVQLPEYGAYSLVRVTYKDTSGAGSTFQLRLGKASSFTLSSANEFYTSTAAIGEATQVNDMMSFPVPFVTDANGRVYLHVAYNSGSDNAGTYVLWFRREVLR